MNSILILYCITVFMNSKNSAMFDPHRQTITESYR